MSTRKFPPAKPQQHGLDANDPLDAPSSSPTPVESAPVEFKSPPETQQEREYGSVPFAPLCPLCSNKQGKEVRMVMRNTKGPMAYYHCATEGCKFVVKTTRPWRDKPYRSSSDVNVAARPDMNNL